MFPLYTLPGHWYQICQIYAMPHFINLALIVRAFQTVWGGGLVGCVQGRGLMVCDCHLGLLLHLLMVPVGTMGLCWPGMALSGLWGEGGGNCGLCPRSRAQCVHTSPSDFYPAGKFP